MICAMIYGIGRQTIQMDMVLRKVHCCPCCDRLWFHSKVQYDRGQRH